MPATVPALVPAFIANLDPWEVVVVAVVAVLIFGKRLPEVLVQMGRQFYKLKRALADLRRESGIDRELSELRRNFDDMERSVRDYTIVDPAADSDRALDPTGKPIAELDAPKRFDDDGESAVPSAEAARSVDPALADDDLDGTRVVDATTGAELTNGRGTTSGTPVERAAEPSERDPDEPARD